MRNLLITGGPCFIGANFVHYWLKNYPGDKVVVLDALTYAGNPANLEPVRNLDNFRFVHGDIQNYELVLDILQNEEIDTIVHFAAESHVDRSIHGPDVFIDANVIGTHSLLKAAKSAWVDTPHSSPLTSHREYRFHHVSTDEVYGSLGLNDPAFTETTPYAPNSPYSASKAASDHLVRAYHKTFGLNVTISNCSNNYGPYQFPEKLIPLTITNILAGKNIPVYGDGLNVRDWLYVDDHCRAIDLILQNDKVSEIYNIGGNNELQNIDLVKLLCAAMDEKISGTEELLQHYPKSPAAKGVTSDTLITYVDDRLGHDRRYAIDIEKIHAELGYSPIESFETGITKTIDWYFANEMWWQQIFDGSYRSISN
jgi:dTDP-glucose 4,6-dehydratase